MEINTKHYSIAFMATMVFISIGCTTTIEEKTQSSASIDGLIIANKTSITLKEVKLKDLDTGKFVSCNAILPKTDCSLGFKKIDEENHAALITWRQGSQTYIHEVKAENSISTRQTHQVHVDIYNEGQIKTYFRMP